MAEVSAVPADEPPTARTGTRIVALYHIGKTGGSSVLVSGHWTKVFNYFHTHCFFAMPAHRSLFPPKYHNLDGTNEYINQCARKGFDPYADWNSSHLLVEFHGTSAGEFWKLLFKPAVLAGLRARHRKFLTAVTLRDPVPHILSFYTMWGWVPTRTDKLEHRQVHALAAALREPATFGSSCGLQTWAMLEGSNFSRRAARQSHVPCDEEATAFAVRRLRAFDFACNLRWLDKCLRALLISLEVKRLPRVAHVRPGQVTKLTGTGLSVTMNATNAELARLDDSIGFGLVQRCAACDEKLVLATEAQWATFPGSATRQLPPT